MSGNFWLGSSIAGEPALVVKPLGWGGGNPKIPAVIYCHGHGGDEMELWRVEGTSVVQRAVMEAIVAAGMPIVSPYLGGNLWGNSKVIADIDQAVSYATSTLGARPDKVLLYGQSMGHVAAMNWARQNKDQVAAVVASMGVTDLNDISAQYTDVATAYPAGDWNTEAYNPMINAGTKFSGIPWQGWIGGSDVTAKTNLMQQFGALLAQEVNVVSGAHSWGTVGNWDIAKIVSFFRTHGFH